MIQQQEILGNTLLWGLVPTAHRFWMINQGQNWFERLWANRFDQYFREIWRKEFRFSVETFDFIKNLVRDKIEKQNTFFRKPIPLEKRVAVALWRLATATGNSYRSISKVFGIGLTSVAKIVYEFCESIFEEVGQFIKFPANGHKTALEMEKFSYFTQTVLPQVVGVLDGTHLEIMCTNSESRVDYFSCKQKYTVNTQAVVGANLMFLHVATGYPGSLHDARILKFSSLFGQAERNEILAHPTKSIDEFNVRPLIFSDSAYPSTMWQIKPFPFRQNLPQHQKIFSKHLSSARVTVERAFGVLKGRFRILMKRMDVDLDNVVKTIITCCVLHNICQKRGDLYIDDDEFLENVLINERSMRGGHKNNQNYPHADALRDVRAEYMFGNK